MASTRFTPDRAVGDIVTAYPATAPMLEALGIDFCCGGKRTLAAAAAEINMPVERVIAVLETAMTQSASRGGTRNWQEAPIDELMAYIVETHHAFLQRELPRLENMLRKVSTSHDAHHGDVLRPLSETFTQLKTELEAHLRKEETVTFPAISHLLRGTADAAALRSMRDLEYEHDHAGELLAMMRAITHEYQTPDDACATYCALYQGLQDLERDIHLHVHLENNILFPRVRMLIASREQAA